MANTHGEHAMRDTHTQYNKMHVYEATLTIPGKGTNMRVQRRARPSKNTNPVHEKLPDRCVGQTVALADCDRLRQRCRVLCAVLNIKPVVKKIASGWVRLRKSP
jgi:hypothetical protein